MADHNDPRHAAVARSKLSLMNHEWTEDDGKSKSQLKRESSAIQRLGEELVEMNPAEVAKLPLPENLLAAIEAARHIRHHSARRRQLQYIGKLMRNIDSDPIRAALDAKALEQRQQTAHFHRIESWRDRLIEDGDEALADFLDAHPAADRSRLRQLLRNAQSERTKQPLGNKASRALFRYLRELMEPPDGG